MINIRDGAGALPIDAATRLFLYCSNLSTEIVFTAMGHRVFEIDIERSLHPERLAWVSGGEAADGSLLCGNQDYMDLRGLGWPAVQEMIALERELLARFAQAPDAGEAYSAYRDEIYEDEDNLLATLDLGVASVVMSLSAAGCVPCTSCNGGALGDGAHQATHPLVAFHLRRDIFDVVVDCAEAANAGLYQTTDGEVVIYARALTDMIAFAVALFDRRQAIPKTSI